MVMRAEVIFDASRMKKIRTRLGKMPLKISNTNKYLPIPLANEYASWLRKSMRQRARKDTGELRSRISVKWNQNRGIFEVKVNSPYGAFQDIGFRPHWVKTSAQTGYGMTIAERYEAKFGKKAPPIIRVSGYKPFTEPAIRASKPQLNRFLRRSLTVAYNKMLKEET